MRFSRDAGFGSPGDAAVSIRWRTLSSCVTSWSAHVKSLSVSGTNAETMPAGRTGSQSAIDTNLCAEFYAASQLQRQGHMVT